MTEISLLNLTQDFIVRVNGLKIEQPIKFTLRELRNNSDWSKWQNLPGIYYFIQNSEILYIGRAFPSVGLGSRIKNQITSYGDAKWDAVIGDMDVILGMLIFPIEDWHWLAAVEVFLIERTKPKINKRCG